MYGGSTTSASAQLRGDPGRAGGQRRQRELRDVLQRLGADRGVLLLRRAHRLVRRAHAGDRVGSSGWAASRPSPTPGCRGPRAARACGSRPAPSRAAAARAARRGPAATPQRRRRIAPSRRRSRCTPNAFLTALTSASDDRVVRDRRCGGDAPGGTASAALRPMAFQHDAVAGARRVMPSSSAAGRCDRRNRAERGQRRGTA